jgi:hypothetical protein
MDGLLRGLPTPQFLIDRTADALPYGTVDMPYAYLTLSIPASTGHAQGTIQSVHGSLDIPSSAITVGQPFTAYEAGMYAFWTDLGWNTTTGKTHTWYINGSEAYGEWNSTIGQLVPLILYLQEGDTVTCGYWNVNSATTKKMSVVRLVSRGTPGPQGPPGQQVEVGTSFPGSPYVQQEYIRSDIRGGTKFFWNGTYWLSRQHFVVPGTHVQALTTDSTYVIRMGPPTDLDLWIERIEATGYVATTNDGSNYWGLETVDISTLGNTTFAAGVPNSSGAGAGWAGPLWTPWTTGYLIQSASGGSLNLEARWVKTGSPGALYATPSWTYRWRAV